jgi:hypothetical protein
MPLTRVNTWAGVCSRSCRGDAVAHPADRQRLCRATAGGSSGKRGQIYCLGNSNRHFSSSAARGGACKGASRAGPPRGADSPPPPPRRLCGTARRPGECLSGSTGRRGRPRNTCPVSGAVSRAARRAGPDERRHEGLRNDFHRPHPERQRALQRTSPSADIPGPTQDVAQQKIHQFLTRVDSSGRLSLCVRKPTPAKTSPATTRFKRTSRRAYAWSRRCRGRTHAPASPVPG